MIKEVRSAHQPWSEGGQDLVEAAPKAVLEKVNKEKPRTRREALDAAGASAVSYS